MATSSQLDLTEIDEDTIVLYQNYKNVLELAGHVTDAEKGVLSASWETQARFNDPDHPEGHKAVVVGSDGERFRVLDEGRVNLLDFTSDEEIENDE